MIASDLRRTHPEVAPSAEWEVRSVCMALSAPSLGSAWWAVGSYLNYITEAQKPFAVATLPITLFWIGLAFGKYSHPPFQNLTQGLLGLLPLQHFVKSFAHKKQKTRNYKQVYNSQKSDVLMLRLVGQITMAARSPACHRSQTSTRSFSVNLTTTTSSMRQHSHRQVLHSPPETTRL